MWNQNSLRLVPSFFGSAKQLRAHFESRFRDPLRTEPGRFVWDYWNVPETFRVIRTPAYEYFPASVYKKFHQRLIQFGREELGCHDVSPPWMSYYVDGCYQATHVDAPHGPWAFVYSLTPWEKRRFRGGETFLKSKKNTTLVAPKFNQLTVFDPAIPHGVKTVRGIENPMHARLVIHGWFVNPRPFISGKLRTSVLASEIGEIGEWLARERLRAKGWSVLKFTVNPSGQVKDLKTLWNRLESNDSNFKLRLQNQVLGMQFGKQSGSSRVTLPLAFD